MSNGKTICTVCNYIFDETLGDPAHNVPPSVPFSSLEKSWRCPECGADQEMFQPCSCVSLSAHSREEEMKKTSIGKLVVGNPLYARVFEELGIDYCCGGGKTLKEVAREKKLDPSMILSKLVEVEIRSQGSNQPDWTKATLKQLVDHIVSTYHFPLREELVRIDKMAQKVAKVHGERHPEMKELANVFSQFKTELEMHMQKEELILFPAIVSSETGDRPQLFGCGGGIENPIKVMLQDHDDAGDTMKKMASLTNNYVAPADACNTFRVLLDSLKRFEIEMHEHVHKENHVLFPRALLLTKPSLIQC
ncbi:MAG: iron-sulfur cluster repair di-iron protein [Candidatus Obscuribacterales bacterium]|nr:iron-sulfur cluster repair di-iron protein [Cyanobacteria bacterium SZAS LIN-5]